MAVDLTVNNTTHSYPEPGDAPGWGEATTAWAQDVTEVLATLLGSDDLPLTSANILNNQSSSVNVSGLSFDTGSVRAASIDYSIYRVSASTTSGKSESGYIKAVYDNSAAPGSKWALAQGNIVGNAGVTFTITDAGQVQYQSTDIGATTYSGEMQFTAKSLPQ